MTYGWAILIIAIVLGALFQLGVFNGQNFAPRTPPGACQVFRPNGPGSTLDINLEGECQGVLPEYVAQYAATYYSTVPNDASINTAWSGGSWTITAWFYLSSSVAGNAGQWIAEEAWGCTSGLWFSPGASAISISASMWSTSGSNCAGSGQGSAGSQISEYTPTTAPYNQWVFATAEFNYFGGGTGNVIACYNAICSSTPWSGTPTDYALDNSWNFVFGGAGTCCGPPYSPIKLANIQLYNTSLSPAEITALYLEGIGGAPISPQYIVGWWPLNGNAQDYSGNGNNGQINGGGVTFSSSYLNGYTAP